MVYRILFVLIASAILLSPADIWAQASAYKAYQSQPQPNHTGSIRGVVLDEVSGETLIGVNLFLPDSQLGAASSATGTFEIQNVPAGLHVLEARMIGFEAVQIPIELTESGEVITLTIKLSEETVTLSEIVVSPDPSVISNIESISPRTFSKQDLQNVPALGGDVYRAITRMPGITAGDFSSKFMIRGGEHDEVLVTLDGLELYDPFHMKDLGGGGLSIIDSGVINGVDLHTGAFPASYGNRMSGVFAIETDSPEEPAFESSIGISFVNARVSTQGFLNGGKTSWKFVGRRGYIDLLLGVVDESYGFVPQYYDVLGKITHKFDHKHTVSLHWLNSGDELTYQEPNDMNDNAHFTYGNTYLWANWKSIWSSRLLSTSMLSHGNVWRNRNGRDIRDDNMIGFLAKDVRSFDVTNLKQDWTFDLASNYVLSWGVDLKHFNSDYTYISTRINQTIPDPVNDPFYVHTTYDEVDVQGIRSGLMASAYAQQRLNIGSRLRTDIGARMGTASWTHDRFVEPRINAAYQLNEQTILRAGWGHFHQVQGIEQLDVQDGAFEFHKAQRAEHIVLGLEHAFDSGIFLRLDAYNKTITNVRPRFLNLFGDATQFFSEVLADRDQIHPESGKARGVELLIKRENRKFNWWASYTLSKVEEKIDGVYVPKTFDQRHAFNVDLNFRPIPDLRINLAWEYRTGWHYTDFNVKVTQLHSQELVLENLYGPYNGEQFPSYHRMDLRVSYDFQLKQNRLSTYLEIRNAYNQQNLRMYTYEPAFENNSVFIKQKPEHWLPVLPAIGIEMKINH